MSVCGMSRKWIVDSGAGVDLVGKEHITAQEHSSQTVMTHGIRLNTANGKTSVNTKVACQIERLNVELNAYMLEQCPPVLSLGRRVIKEGYDFTWKAKDPMNPKLIAPDGSVVKLSVDNYVPVFHENPSDELEQCSDMDCAESGSAVDTSHVEGAHLSALPGNTDTISGEGGDHVGMDGEQMDIHDDDDDDDLETPEINKSAYVRIGKTKEAAKTRAHLLTHYPKNNFCECCRRTKTISSPAKKIRPGSEKVKTEKFGQVIHADHLIIGDSSKGLEGERVALALIDQHTKFGYAYPASSKSAEEVTFAIRRFMGDQVDWRQVAIKSDNSHEIKSAVKSLGLAHYVSTPYRYQSNGLVERFIRRLVESTRAGLDQAGLPLEMWPHGIRHAALCYNMYAPVSDDGKTPWVLRMGDECDWTSVVAFGSKVHAMIHGGAHKAPKLAPSMSECVLLSWHCAPGFVWKDNEVMLVSQGHLVDSGSEVHVHRTKEVMGIEQFVFPFAKDKFGCGPREESAANIDENLEDADDRTLKITGEGLDTAENEGVLSKDMLDKGWRIDKFCERLVKTPPNSPVLLVFLLRIGAPKEVEESEGRVRESKDGSKTIAEGASSADTGASSSTGTGAAPMVPHAKRDYDMNGEEIRFNHTRCSCESICEPVCAASSEFNRKRVWFAGEGSPTDPGLVLDLNDRTCEICSEQLQASNFGIVFVEVCCGLNPSLESAVTQMSSVFESPIGRISLMLRQSSSLGSYVTS
eukprot:6476389-Amphidinium_carterae.1